MAAAIDLLRHHPCPLMGWKALATLGRVRTRLGAAPEARAAFAEAAAIVADLASSVDGELQRRFLASPAVKEVVANAGADQPARSSG